MYTFVSPTYAGHCGVLVPPKVHSGLDPCCSNRCGQPSCIQCKRLYLQRVKRDDSLTDQSTIMSWDKKNPLFWDLGFPNGSNIGMNNQLHFFLAQDLGIALLVLVVSAWWLPFHSSAWRLAAPVEGALVIQLPARSKTWDQLLPEMNSWWIHFF